MAGECPAPLGSKPSRMAIQRSQITQSELVVIRQLDAVVGSSLTTAKFAVVNTARLVI